VWGETEHKGSAKQLSDMLGNSKEERKGSGRKEGRRQSLSALNSTAEREEKGGRLKGMGTVGRPAAESKAAFRRLASASGI
jgi:hypothetical protein